MIYRAGKILLLFLFGSALFWPNFIFAESENLKDICQIDTVEQSCKVLEPTECRKLLEKCEAYYQQESDKAKADLAKTEQEKKTLQNKVNSLKKKIDDLNYQIKQGSLVIKDLGLQIEDTSASITKTSQKINGSKEQLSAILRNIHEQDQKPLIEILFAETDLSGFFDNLSALEMLNVKSTQLLQNIKALKLNLEEQKQSLDSEKNDLEQTVKIQNLQKTESSKTKAEQEQYLSITEKEYQRQLQEKQDIEKKAATIRARIFELVGVPQAPTFGQAYEIAKYVSSITGVRPAFLLAVITQESNLGRNVGQCYLTNTSTGAGIRVPSNQVAAKVMNPQRDIPAFLVITAELGRDPLNTLVSCPMSFGWGGAMGPAQFIPSTWAMYKNRVNVITGKIANPWNINDAFLAAALYLSDYGAAKKDANNEWRAAMIYFSGSTNTKYRFYGDSVAKIAKDYGDDIAKLEASK